MRLWYGNEGGFGVLTDSPNRMRQIRYASETWNSGNGPVRIYPARRNGRFAVQGEAGRDESGAVDPVDLSPERSDSGASLRETAKSSVEQFPAGIAFLRPMRGRPTTYHPELSRHEARLLRERERYTRQKSS